MKNGVKNKSVAFIIFRVYKFQCVCVYIYIYIYIYIYLLKKKVESNRNIIFDENHQYSMHGDDIKPRTFL